MVESRGEAPPVRVAVRAADPLSHAGLSSFLATRPEVSVVAPGCDPQVVIVAAERVDGDIVATLRRVAESSRARLVLIAADLAEADLLAVIECRVVAVLPRAAASGDRLIGSVRAAAAGGGFLPSDLLGVLLRQVARLQREVLAPHGLSACGLTQREIDVLRLMADGFETAEIAAKLCYSERAVKNVIYALTSRLNLRNRAHAVAHAMRAGVI